MSNFKRAIAFIIPLLFAGHAAAAIALVNVSTANFGTGNGTVTLKSTLQAGNCVVVFVTGQNGAVSSITDNTGGGSNKYQTGSAKSTNGTSGNVEVWYSTGIAGAATTVTVNTSNTGPQVWIYELSGVVSGQNPFETTGVTNNGASSATPAGPSLTIANAGDFLIEAMSFGGTLTGVNAPWTARTVISGNLSASYAPGSTGTFNPTFTTGAANTFAASGVAVLPVAAGGATVNERMKMGVGL